VVAKEKNRGVNICILIIQGGQNTTMFNHKIFTFLIKDGDSSVTQSKSSRSITILCLVKFHKILAILIIYTDNFYLII
jgi:hypothetical protein